MTENRDWVNVPEGWDDVGTPDIDGWCKLEDGIVVTGTKVSSFVVDETIDGERRQRTVLAVKLDHPFLGMLKGGEPVELSAGDVLGVTVVYGLKALLDYEDGSKVWFRADDQVKLGGRKKLWKFTCRARGKKVPAQPVVRKSNPTSDDDVVPF